MEDGRQYTGEWFMGKQQGERHFNFFSERLLIQCCVQVTVSFKLRMERSTMGSGKMAFVRAKEKQSCPGFRIVFLWASWFTKANSRTGTGMEKVLFFILMVPNIQDRSKKEHTMGMALQNMRTDPSTKASGKAMLMKAE